MSNESLGIIEGVSISLGGMIGGGIFAVLGVVAQITRGATWFAFILAGTVALCTAYSFNVLNKLSDGQGGTVTFIQCFLENSTLAGMAGWTLLFGYIGSMAMYAYAFGSFTVGFQVIPYSIAYYPLRPIVSVLVIICFVGLNILGSQTTGSVENILVEIKIAILLIFGIGGIYYGFNIDQLEYGLSHLTSLSPLIAAGVSFVAFQGWQLLFYDQENFKNPITTIKKAVYISILSAVGIYIIIAITTVSLVPLDVIQSHPERALAVAADPFIPYGFTIISLAALFSTGSAINATLFSAGYFTKGMISNNLVPDQIGNASQSGIPTRTVIILGGIISALTAFGSLEAITSFASLTFIIIFGAMNYLAFCQRKQTQVNTIIPAIGSIGAIGFFFLMLSHLFQAEPKTFYSVILIAIAVFSVEIFYFKRKVIKEEVTTFEEIIQEETPDIE